MMPTKYRSLSCAAAVIITVVLSSLAQAEITITGPTTPIEPREYVRLDVTGISDADLARAVVSVSPPDGVQIETYKTWGNQPIILFKARAAGKYLLSVSLNPWRQHLDSGAKAAADAKVDSQLLAELQLVVGKLAVKYPSAGGQLALEVGGVVPPPPPPDPPDPDPPEPIPPLAIAEQLVILRDQRQATTKMQSVLLDLQERFQRGSKPEMFLLDKHDPSGAAGAYLALKPASSAFPYYFLIAKGGKVLAQGPVADSVEAQVDLIKKFQAKE